MLRVRHYNVRKRLYPDMTKRYGIVYVKPGRLPRSVDIYVRNHAWSFWSEKIKKARKHGINDSQE